MENKVGDNVPSQKQLDDMLKQLASLVDQIKEFCVTLQKEERAATAKPHKGTESLATQTYNLAKRYGITVKNVPLEGMMNDLRLASQIQPFDTLFNLGAQLAADTTLQAKSEYYTAFLSYYGALSAAAEHDAALAAEMEPIQKAMAALRRSRKSAGNGDVASPAAPAHEPAPAPAASSTPKNS
jgi:hypothetical protein